MVSNAFKQYETHQNVSLGSNGLDRVRLLRKIPTQLCGTNICTCSARFAQSFVRQPNGHQCTQIEKKHTKTSVQGPVGWIVCIRCEKFRSDFVHELLHQFGPFCIEFHNATKRSSMYPNITNAPNHQFRVHWDGSGAFVAKNSDATSWHKILHQFGPFCTEFRKTTKRSQMHSNSTKHTKTLVQGPMGWIGCVCCEKFRRDFVAQTFALVRPVLHQVS